MTILRSEEWSNAHLEVNDRLGELLNQIRDLGYNPSLHVTYDKAEQHLLVHGDILSKHSELQQAYEAYIEACQRRDEALDKIQSLPKLDIGF